MLPVAVARYVRAPLAVSASPYFGFREWCHNLHITAGNDRSSDAKKRIGPTGSKNDSTRAGAPSGLTPYEYETKLTKGHRIEDNLRPMCTIA